MSFSYASSEIIVEIIVITEKCSPGFVLITQVTARAPGFMVFAAGYLASLGDDAGNNSMSRFAAGK